MKKKLYNYLGELHSEEINKLIKAVGFKFNSPRVRSFDTSLEIVAGELCCDAMEFCSYTHSKNGGSICKKTEEEIIITSFDVVKSSQALEDDLYPLFLFMRKRFGEKYVEDFKTYHNHINKSKPQTKQ